MPEVHAGDDREICRPASAAACRIASSYSGNFSMGVSPPGRPKIIAAKFLQ